MEGFYVFITNFIATPFRGKDSYLSSTFLFILVFCRVSILAVLLDLSESLMLLISTSNIPLDLSFVNSQTIHLSFGLMSQSNLSIFPIPDCLITFWFNLQDMRTSYSPISCRVFCTHYLKQLILDFSAQAWY